MSLAAKEALGLGKGDFAKKFSTITTNHRTGTKLVGKPKDFILIACRLAERFSKMANEAEVEVRLKNWKVGPRKVKMVVLKRKDGFEQPVDRKSVV